MKPVECERCGQIAEYSCNDEYLCDMHTREAIDDEIRGLFVRNRILMLSICPIEDALSCKESKPSKITIKHKSE